MVQPALIGTNHTCLLFRAEAGPHLPTPEGWQVELAWGQVTYRDKCQAPKMNLDTITHPSTNRARRRITFKKHIQCPTTNRAGHWNCQDPRNGKNEGT